MSSLSGASDINKVWKVLLLSIIKISESSETRLNFDVIWSFGEILNLILLITDQIAVRGTLKIMFKIFQRKLFMNYNLSELKRKRYPTILEDTDWADTASSY